MCLLVKVATLRLLVLYFIAGFFALYFIAIFTSTSCCCFCQWHDLHTDWRQVPGCGCNHRGRRSQKGKWERFLLESPPPPACWQFSCKETQSFILFGFLLPPPPPPPPVPPHSHLVWHGRALWAGQYWKCSGLRSCPAGTFARETICTRAAQSGKF